MPATETDPAKYSIITTVQPLNVSSLKLMRISPSGRERVPELSQKNRYFTIRKARSIKKAEKIAHHFDTMEKRSQQVTDIRRIKEVAEEARVEDQEYHMTVLKKWAENAWSSHQG